MAQKLGPYLLLEVLLPGGTLLALLFSCTSAGSSGFSIGRRKSVVGCIPPNDYVAYRWIPSRSGASHEVPLPCLYG